MGPVSSSNYDTADEESRILVIGSRFENLRIAGHKVEVELHHELAQKLDTFEAVREAIASNADFRKMAGDPFAGKKLPKTREAHGVVYCCRVNKIHPAQSPRIVLHGHLV